MEDILSLLQENSKILIPIAMFLAVAVIGFISYYYSNKSVLLRAFKTSRKKSINSIQQNEYAKVIGKAKYVNQPLIAPLSGRQCVYYHIIIEVKGDKHWRKIIDDVKTQDFFIETNSEMTIVKSSNLNKSSMRFHLVKDHKEKSGFRNDAPEKLEQYLISHNKKSTGILGINKSMRYSEGVIELDETIAVKGVANWKALNEPIEGYSYSKILTLTGNKKEKLLITDEPKALLRVNDRL
ncbi:hypothetical protein MBM09_00725 [Flaviramulus sp. BrNp1-15]|uniref:hypothetical protein n=1 Tax=Flaviramulus sp. BrNp1-15 TaxID=2916754 RepID=UPI001EE8F3BF|nr:hypothetical protein [Flaviramulus sp. BrNp1-15]ULC59517.1 hypothetical protein MBM09_00725 [Flaviramulus sp. BrNp1-15]